MPAHTRGWCPLLPGIGGLSARLSQTAGSNDSLDATCLNNERCLHREELLGTPVDNLAELRGGTTTWHKGRDRASQYFASQIDQRSGRAVGHGRICSL